MTRPVLMRSADWDFLQALIKHGSAWYDIKDYPGVLGMTKPIPFIGNEDFLRPYLATISRETWLDPREALGREFVVIFRVGVEPWFLNRPKRSST